MQPLKHAKSLYLSCVVSNFHETEIDIWAGFGPVCNTKKNWVDYDLLLGCFYMFSWTKKYLIFLKNIVASAQKSCIK